MTTAEVSRRNVARLIEDGGPCVRYRAFRELEKSPLDPDAESALAGLLSEPRVRRLLDGLGSFDPAASMTLRHLNAIHGCKAECIENAVSTLLELGLHAGIPEFDAALDRIAGYVTNGRVLRATETSSEAIGVEAGRSVFVAVMIASFLLRAGYGDPAVIRFAVRRLEKLRSLAEAEEYVVYLSDDEACRLPRKRPPNWNAVPILRPDYDPTAGCRPLPLVHDLFAVASLPESALSPRDAETIGLLMKYVLDPRFEDLPDGYGLLWNGKDRAYYGCGWSPHIAAPGDTGRREALIVQHAELLSRFEAGARSARAGSLYGHLLTFRLPDGGFLFPRNYLQEKKTGYYVGGFRMGLEADRKARKAFGLESTFRMELIASNLRRFYAVPIS